MNAAGRAVVAEAAADFQRSGQAQVEVVGHTDTSGSSAYNQKLSLRRADAVRAELERLGVPAAAIVSSGRGQDDLLVPTADHVREPQNRRVEIIVPQPPPQAPVAAAPEQPPPPPVASPAEISPRSRSVRSTATISARRTSGNGKTQNDLLGPELRLRLFPDDAVASP